MVQAVRTFTPDNKRSDQEIRQEGSEYILGTGSIVTVVAIHDLAKSIAAHGDGQAELFAEDVDPMLAAALENAGKTTWGRRMLEALEAAALGAGLEDPKAAVMRLLAYPNGTSGFRDPVDLSTKLGRDRMKLALKNGVDWKAT